MTWLWENVALISRCNPLQCLVDIDTASLAKFCIIDTASFASLPTLCVSYFSIYLLCLSSLCCDFLVQSLPAQFRCILQFCRKVKAWSRSQQIISTTTILLKIVCDSTIKRNIRNEKKKQGLTSCKIDLHVKYFFLTWRTRNTRLFSGEYSQSTKLTFA